MCCMLEYKTGFAQGIFQYKKHKLILPCRLRHQPVQNISAKALAFVDRVWELALVKRVQRLLPLHIKLQAQLPDK